MKKVSGLKIGDKVWTWGLDERQPVEAVVTRLYLFAETRHLDGKRGRAHIATLGSTHPGDYISHELAESANEVHELRAKDLLHEAHYHLKAEV